ncbi:MAG: tRNA pseudouridine(38-40) synthase TruA [Ignavibacteria bacterium]|nr:tRNA pseudouridine(38-40) synthase TruA [Bacteroidota bacterium]MBL7129479.1 tRNA pseudouridine(38-40) synthase TruA [Ignavibacteria bacterium]
MFNYKLTIEYDGKDFNGWQRQKNTVNTIQEILESSLTNILRENISVIGSGRTDTGVHALNQVANFKFERQFDNQKVLYSLNSVLPKTITVKNIKRVPLNFHARYSALKREYKYQVTFEKRSIGADYFYKLNYELDYRLIDEFIEILKGNHSFKSLCKNQTDKNDFLCNILVLKYVLNKSELVFNIIANRFLHSMVRATIGCLIDIGRGKLDFNKTKKEFEKGDKIRALYLPGNALFLKKIYY